MSASISAHGPFTASTRLVSRSSADVPPFVTLDIRTPGVQINLIDIDTTGLDSLTEAITLARALVADIKVTS